MVKHAKQSRVPPERDFTAGLVGGGRRAFVGSTGEPELAELLRVVFRCRRKDFGRLRQLIDAVNRKNQP
jgi:hypothetical protein